MEKGIKTRRGREFWQSAINDQGRMGVSVAAYCQNKGLEQATFYAWRKRLDSEDASNGIEFAPITVKETSANGVELLLPGGLILRFSGLAPVDYLRQLSAAYVGV